MIREIQKQDIKEVLPLLELMYNIHQVEIPFFMPPLESVAILEERLTKMMRLEGFYQFVYISEGKIAGYMDMSVHGPHMDLLFTSDATIILDTLILYPEYRGQNIAEKMIAFARQHAKGLGFNTMELHVLTSFPNLHDHYKKHGFKDITNYMTCDL